MKKIMTLGGLALLALSLTLAQDRINPPNRAGGNDIRTLRQLKLTDDQRKSIGTIRFELRKKTVDQQARIKTARLECAELLKAAEPNQSAIQKKAAEISQLQSQQRLLFIDHWFAVNKLLTPDQQIVWKRVSGRLWAGQKARVVRGRAQELVRSQGNPRRFLRAPGAIRR
jgi:Spy/CpxP family protein refolding chaperone